jgi:hypothetical protein
MSYRISILDKSPLAAGETAAQALTRTLTLAQQAEAWGYHRFWIAEHHNTDQLASPSPEVVIAWILGQTRQIRVGSGGVMLQHYSPYKVAESVAQALGVHPAEKGTFADSLAQLDNWLSLTDAAGKRACAPRQSRRAAPTAFCSAPAWRAFSSPPGWTGILFSPPILTATKRCCEVLTRWRALSRRDAIVAIQVIVAEESATARLAQQVGLGRRTGKRPAGDGGEAQAAAFARQAGSPPVRIARRDLAAGGNRRRGKAQLDALHAPGILTNLSSTRRSAKGRRVSTHCACWLRPILARRCCHEL